MDFQKNSSRCANWFSGIVPGESVSYLRMPGLRQRMSPIALFVGDSLIQKRVATNSNFLIPCIVLGELYYGAQKSKRTNENMAKIKDFINSTVVLNCDINTACDTGS